MMVDGRFLNASKWWGGGKALPLLYWRGFKRLNTGVVLCPSLSPCLAWRMSCLEPHLMRVRDLRMNRCASIAIPADFLYRMYERSVSFGWLETLLSKGVVCGGDLVHVCMAAQGNVCGASYAPG
jgi:hypothetical protein